MALVEGAQAPLFSCMAGDLVGGAKVGSRREIAAERGDERAEIRRAMGGP